jgi:hypothetical protein
VASAGHTRFLAVAEKDLGLGLGGSFCIAFTERYVRTTKLLPRAEKRTSWVDAQSVPHEMVCGSDGRVLTTAPKAATSKLTRVFKPYVPFNGSVV